jgi:hypothetical protein
MKSGHIIHGLETQNLVFVSNATVTWKHCCMPQLPVLRYFLEVPGSYLHICKVNPELDTLN